MLLSHRIRIEATSAQRDSFACKLCSACGVKNGMLGLGQRAWTCEACGACHDRDTDAGINVKRLATGALAARPALAVASQAATPGTAVEDVSAAGGKVTPARHEPGQQDGSGQEENAAHLCARF
jgi:putative transposase